ncbi:MAG TPA: electron transport complex subunit RsxE [Candidatus Acidoferrum sp.]|nr:electron transport complex subunit RsxE [Candidatus Acidoferrum sp.]
MSNSLPHDTTSGVLWRRNPALVQLLGLSPLLAVTTSVVTALGLGLATLAVFTAASVTISLLHRRLNDALRLPLILLVNATFATCIGLMLQVWSLHLYQALGLYVPLIAANSLLLVHVDSIASERPLLTATAAGLLTGFGYLLVLLVFGALRELLGTGAVFANMEQLLPFAASWKLQIFTAESPFLLVLLPPGAFLLLGFLVALKNVIDRQLARPVANETSMPGGKRVRVTGKI